jgi:Entner-Doudoroff aldolase
MPLAETGAPFIFMNAAGTMDDVTTMVHEGGHAIHSFLTHPLELTGFKEYGAEIAEVAISAGMPYHPGVATPSEIIQGLTLGLKVLKFFPAEALGGMKTLNSMSAPFRDLRFIPTGGIDLKLLPDYLQSKKVAAVGGSWMVPQTLVDQGQYEEITQLTLQALEVVRKIKEGQDAKN